MLLSDLLTPARIRIPITAGDKRGVLGELAQVLADGNGADPQDLLAAVEEREALLPTGIGFGVATPHGKSARVTDLRVAAGVSPKAIAYDAIDGQPVRLFFLLVGPEREAAQQVKALGRIARLARNEPLRQRLMDARDPREFHRILREAEGR